MTDCIVLDGVRLAQERAPGLAERARRIHEERGRPLSLAFAVFGDPDGPLEAVPHVGRKLRACATAGVRVGGVVLGAGGDTEQALSRFRALVADHPRGGAWDGVFLQHPFPPDVDGDLLARVIPAGADVDLMAPGAEARFMAEPRALPPLTVAAALALLRAGPVAVAGRRGALVAEADAFGRIFREALVREGVAMEPLVHPDDPELREKTAAAELVVSAAGRPGLLDAGALAPGAVVVDAGYFNPGGTGDVDVTAGTLHLAALAPVPGGVGPMTISALVERVILLAERGAEG